MRDLKKRTTFYFYYRVTEYGFYTDAEKRRIMRLIALAVGHKESEIGELFDTVMTLEADKMNDPINCKNYLLVANFMRDVSQRELEAVEALNEFYENFSNSKRYSGRGSWCRALFNESNCLDRGFFEYATNSNLSNAVTQFESAIKGENGDWPIPELIAVVSLEAGDCRKALKYAIIAQWVDKYTKIDIPWISHIEKEAKNELGETVSNEIESQSRARNEHSCRIGFLA